PRRAARYLGGALGGRRNPSLIRDLVTGQVIRPA
ncbi:tRNA threonylcarbamoyladenosine biosynthesis protein RimN, partial [Pseudomonas aeruginosa]|nr:tRNA threonylcarbamoyladenosine biosynthesis protein RimN [Pseudomonas aeruginosa]